MKKILAMVLAMMLVLSMSVAFAAEEESTTTTTTVDTTGWKSTATTTTIKKAYAVNGGTTVPNEELTFTVTAATDNPADSTVTVTPVTVDAANEDITVNLPSYTVAGIYHYTIKENAGKTQGVTYSTEKIALSVLVAYDYTNKCLTATPGITAIDKAKDDTINNVYDLGSLTVSKEVEGNLGNKTKKFDIVVEFTTDANKPVLSTITASDGQEIAADEWSDNKASLTISIAHGEEVTFSDIPAGVTYTVTEAAKHTTGPQNGQEGYSVQYDYNDAKKAIAAEDEDTVKVTNTKKTEVDTGIALDNAPYMILMALVVVAGAALIVKRASANR